MLRRRSIRIAAGILLLLVVALAALAWWLPDEDALARRAEQALSQHLSVPVHIGRLHWALLPVPLVEVDNARTEQDIPVVIDHITAWPRLWPLLLHREIALDRVLLQGATLPQMSLRALSGAESKQPQGPFHVGALPLARLEFHDVTWIGRRAIPLEFDGSADFDAGWRPRQAAVWRTGVTPPARLDLHRIEGQDRWKADIAVGGGTWNGTLALQELAEQRVRITGELDPRGVDIVQMLQAFNRHSVIAGRASGRTTLRAEGHGLGDIVQSLHTRTQFSVSPATVLRFDLDKAIRSLGREHDGSTPLQSLTGVLDTQNGADGITLHYTELQAKSGALTATGTVTLQNRRIDADLAVDLVDGIVGVPLKITGPVTSPSYSVPAGAIAGAAVGTAVLPGVGTAIGARIGDTIGRLFGGGNGRAIGPGARKGAPVAPSASGPARKAASTATEKPTAPSGPPQSR